MVCGAKISIALGTFPRLGNTDLDRASSDVALPGLRTRMLLAGDGGSDWGGIGGGGGGNGSDRPWGPLITTPIACPTCTWAILEYFDMEYTEGKRQAVGREDVIRLP